MNLPSVSNDNMIPGLSEGAPIDLKEKRILFLVAEDWLFLLFRLDLARALRDAGADVFVVTPRGSKSENIEAEGFNYFPLRLERKSFNPFRELRSVAEIFRIYRRVKPQLVHHVAIKPILYGTLAARLSGTPCIVNAVTGLGYVFLSGGWKRRMLRLLIERLYRWLMPSRHTAFIFQNPDDANLFVERKLVRQQQVNLIRGSGVDPDIFRPMQEPEYPVTILLAARMLWDKGIGDLIEAVRLMKNEGLEFKLVLAGMSDSRNPAAIPEAQLRKWQKQELAEWIGFQDDMVPVYQRCHIVCLPSYREGVPKSLIEAASCGKPIVTTNVPGCREIVVDNVNGILVPVKNPTALAVALEKLLGDRELRLQFGRAGRERVIQDFVMDRVIGETKRLYLQLLVESVNGN